MIRFISIFIITFICSLPGICEENDKHKNEIKNQQSMSITLLNEANNVVKPSRWYISLSDDQKTLDIEDKIIRDDQKIIVKLSNLNKDVTVMIFQNGYIPRAFKIKKGVFKIKLNKYAKGDAHKSAVFVEELNPEIVN